MKKLTRRILFLVACAFSVSASAASGYPSVVGGTSLNTWTSDYSGVLSAAQQTGNPVLLVVVNSATCSHCHLLAQLTLSSPEFAQMEKDLAFYEVLMDESASSSQWNTVLDKYYPKYFNSGAYPLIAVLRTDGSVYKSYGNFDTDNRNVTSDVRSWIEELAAEQGASGDDTPHAPVAPAAMTAADWAARLKGKANGVMVDAQGGIVGSLVIKVTTRGKVSVKVSTASGNTSVKGELALEGDKPVLDKDGFYISYDAESSAWIGKWGSNIVCASAIPIAPYVGVYTAEARADGGKCGYLTVTIKGSKGKSSGKVDGKNKISANGAVVALPSRFVAAHMPELSLGEDIAVVPVIKRGRFSGGVVVGKSGVVMLGAASAFGAEWRFAGSKWSTAANLAALDGYVLTISSATPIEVPITAAGTKIKAVDNAYGLKVSAKVRNGTFKGKAKAERGKYAFEGALIKTGEGIVGVGVSSGAGIHPVYIGSACGDDCSVNVR